MPQESERRVRVGPAGWSYPDWAGIVYPAKKPQGFHEAEYLATFFDTIEINVTFYRPISEKTARSWVRRIEHNPRFLFTLKLWQELTHKRDLTDVNERAVRPALEALAAEKRLGALLMQFPWSFKDFPESRRYVEKLAERLREFPLVLEVRHASWNKPGFYDWLAASGIGFCNIDQPVIGKSLTPSELSTAPVGYVRLHGRNYNEWFRERPEGDRQAAAQRYNYLYSVEELKPWVDRIQQVARNSRQTFVVTNNHFGGKGATNALQLRHLLSGKKVKAPASLIKSFPQELQEISVPEKTESGLFD